MLQRVLRVRGFANISFERHMECAYYLWLYRWATRLFDPF
jgi:hypothetical protein